MYRMPHNNGRWGARGGYNRPPQPRAPFGPPRQAQPYVSQSAPSNSNPLTASSPVIPTNAYYDLLAASGQNLIGVAQALQSQSYAPTCAWPYAETQTPYVSQSHIPGPGPSFSRQSSTVAHGSAGFSQYPTNERGPVHSRIGPVHTKIKSCSYCRGQGHIRRFCPKLCKKNLDKKQANIICRKCLRPGHIARSCPNPTAQSQEATAKPPAKPAGSIPKNRSAGILKKKSSRKGSGLSKDLQDLDDAVLGDPRVQVDGSPPTSENDKSS